MKHLKELLKASGGFTMIELVVVMAILAVLAGLVAGAMGGLGASGQNARLASDRDAIGKGTDRFFNDSFPQGYPIMKPTELLPIGAYAPGQVSVGVIDWDARLPQDPRTTFVPDYVKEIPASAALVSWRLDERMGSVFYTTESALLIPPSTARMDISSSLTTLGTQPVLTWTTRIKKDEAAQEKMEIAIPAGYTIGGQALVRDTVLGTFKGTFLEDNLWTPGQPKDFFGTLFATGVADEWELRIDFPAALIGTGFIPNSFITRTQKISVVTPTTETPGKMILTVGRVAEDPDWHTSSQVSVLALGGIVAGYSTAPVSPSVMITTPTVVKVVTNPGIKDVYRWLTKEHTTIDVEGVWKLVAGNQSVVIKQ